MRRRKIQLVERKASTAPVCVVIGCERLSALTDTAVGKLYRFLSYYCAECYEQIADGKLLEIDFARLEMLPAAEEPLLDRQRAKCTSNSSPSV
jgi:hypothetical protein